MKKILVYSPVLKSILSYDDEALAAALLASYDVVITERRPDDPPEDLESDLLTMKYALSLNPKMTFAIKVDASTSDEDDISEIVTAYGTTVRSIAYKGTEFTEMTRVEQIDALKWLRDRNLNAIFLTSNLQDLVLSIERDPENPSAQALPLSPSDLVIIEVVVATDDLAVADFIHDGLVIASRRFNNNRQFGVVYLWSTDSGYNTALALRQKYVDMAAFWRAEYVGFGVGDHYDVGTAITLDFRDSNYETKKNHRYFRIDDGVVRREDGLFLRFSVQNHIQSGAISYE